jgi:hypothetical protein
MSQRPSKPVPGVAARGRLHTSAAVPAKPPVDIRSRAPRSRLRPLAQLGPTEGSANTQSATGPQSYLQWAGFMAGTPSGDFGFGAYFDGEEPIGAYTWSPSRRG